MTTPDIDSFSSDYGGPYQNAHQIEDPTTDLGDVALNNALCSTAMMTHTAIRAWALFTGVAYTSGTVAVVPDDHNAMWGSSSAVRPTVGETAAGIYTLTWAASQLDELGVAHTLNIRVPFCQVYGADGLRGKVISWTSRTVTINVTSAGALNALIGTKIVVWWI